MTTVNGGAASSPTTRSAFVGETMAPSTHSLPSTLTGLITAGTAHDAATALERVTGDDPSKTTRVAVLMSAAQILREVGSVGHGMSPTKSRCEAKSNVPVRRNGSIDVLNRRASNIRAVPTA